MAESVENPSIFHRIKQAAAKGVGRGFYGIHSTHPLVIKAAMRCALNARDTLLLEFDQPQRKANGSMHPADYAAFVLESARENGFPLDQLVLGGGRLMPDEQTCAAAKTWITECVEAGFEKIYLESCDSNDPQQIAETQVDLCRAAEAAFARSGSRKGKPHYVLGTPFADANSTAQTAAVDAAVQVAAIWEAARAAFHHAGLEDAWQRVIAVAVQPDAGYTDYRIKPYQAGSALALKQYCEEQDQFVYEIRSADYQPAASLDDLLADRFAILGIGPQLTFTMREALFSLAMLENEWMIGKPGARLSNLIVELDKAMQLDPQGWRDSYRGNGFDQLLARKYSYRDLSRNYWQERDVRAAVEQLMKNLDQDPPPLPMLRQFFAESWASFEEEKAGSWTENLVIHKIQNVIETFSK